MNIMKVINISNLSIISLSIISPSTLVSCTGVNSVNAPASVKPIAEAKKVATVNQAQDTLVFGHFYGQCRGETCVETFKLANGKVYEDTKDDYTHQSFNFQPLSKRQYHQVKSLLTQVPTELLTHKEGQIGCPDCADGGGIYIAVTQKGTLKSGTVRSWQIDTNLNNIPASLHQFVKSVQSNIQLLQQPKPIICPTHYDPVCVKEVLNGQEVFNTYGNRCAVAGAKGLVLSTTKGACQ